MRLNSVIACLLLFTSASAQASIFGEENVALSKMIAQLEAMYTKMSTMVDEAKAQNETLLKVNDAIKTVKEERDAVQNTFLRDLDEVIKRDLEDITELDELSGMTVEQKLLALSREFDRRLSQPLSAEERQHIEAQQRLLKQEEYLLKLEKASKENLSKAADGVTDKEAAQITAESAAIYAALAASEKSRQLESERQQLQDTIQHDRIMEMQSGVFGAASKRER